jgi:predicted ribonuclease YlaK
MLEELDKFKTQSSELGRNARESIRKLDTCDRAESSPKVSPAKGGTLRVLATPRSRRRPGGGHAGNQLILLAYHLLRRASA